MTDVVGVPESRTPSIELRSIRKVFGEFVAVNDLSLTVEPGEFLTLLGPSGCGKTTTLRMIGGFEYPTSGTLLINGQEMGNRPPYARPVNTVFQNYALFPHLTVGRNIEYGLQMSKVPKDERRRRVGEALEMVRLPHVEDRKPGELSGGQQQRVALARALVNRPQVLLLDEPLGALDLKLRKTMQFELKELNREVKATFIYVTHDQEEALTMSDRIAVMSEGRILQIGSPVDIYERPRNQFVADFIGQTNFLHGEIISAGAGTAEVGIAGSRAIRSGLPDGAPVHGPAVVTVRPERVSFASDFPEGVPTGWNMVLGSLREVVYLGTHTQFVIQLVDGQRFTVHRQNSGPRAAAELGIGDMATAVFDPKSTTVLTP